MIGAQADLTQEVILDIPEVAKFLKVRDSTVRNLHRMRLLRGLMIGRHLRFRQVDVLAYVRNLKAVS